MLKTKELQGVKSWARISEIEEVQKTPAGFVECRVCKSMFEQKSPEIIVCWGCSRSRQRDLTCHERDVNGF